MVVRALVPDPGVKTKREAIFYTASDDQSRSGEVTDGYFDRTMDMRGLVLE